VRNGCPPPAAATPDAARARTCMRHTKPWKERTEVASRSTASSVTGARPFASVSAQARDAAAAVQPRLARALQVVHEGREAPRARRRTCSPRRAA